MSIVLEIIGTAISTCGTTIGALALKRKLMKVQPDVHGALPWLWKRDKGGIYCIKCWNTDKNKRQPPICECLEYPDLHFHFECQDCGFKSLMRTADNK